MREAAARREPNITSRNHIHISFVPIPTEPRARPRHATNQPTMVHNEPTNERATKNMIHAVKRQGAATERTRPPSESHITLNAQGGRRARSSVRPSVRQGRHSVLLKLLPMSRRLLNETGGGIRKGRLNDRKTQVSVWSGGRPCHTDGLTDGPIAEWLPLQQSILAH